MSDLDSNYRRTFVKYLRIEKAHELEHGNRVLHISTYPYQSQVDTWVTGRSNFL